MDPITTWRFWTEAIGYVQVYPTNYSTDDGPAIVGLGNGVDSWAIFDLGGGNIALGILLNNDGQMVMAYWNSHSSMPGGTGNGGMVLWSNDEGFASNSIGPEQTLKLINMGAGRFALQMTAGPNAGQYLKGQQGGSYPDQWGYGTGSLFAMPDDGPPSSFGLMPGSDQLPILKITQSGYWLALAGKDLTGCILTDMRHCTLDGATLSGITTLVGADFTSASLRKAILSGLDLGQA